MQQKQLEKSAKRSAWRPWIIWKSFLENLWNEATLIMLNKKAVMEPRAEIE